LTQNTEILKQVGEPAEISIAPFEGSVQWGAEGKSGRLRAKARGPIATRRYYIEWRQAEASGPIIIDRIRDDTNQTINQ
jgi:hypothetical protein